MGLMGLLVEPLVLASLESLSMTLAMELLVWGSLLMLLAMGLLGLLVEPLVLASLESLSVTLTMGLLVWVSLLMLLAIGLLGLLVEPLASGSLHSDPQGKADLLHMRCKMTPSAHNSILVSLRRMSPYCTSSVHSEGISAAH